MIHVNARAPRWPNAVAPGATRSIAPPIHPVTTCVCGVGRVLEPGEQRVDEPIAHLRQVVHPVVEPPAVRGGRVEHLLEGHVRHRGDEVERRAARRRCSGASTRAPSSRSPLHATLTSATLRPCSVGRERRAPAARSADVEDRQLLRGVRHQVAARPERLGAPLPRRTRHPRQHHRPDAMGAELELRDDAEVPAAAAQRPEQLGVLVVARRGRRTRRRARPRRTAASRSSGRAAHQPPDPAAERQARRRRCARSAPPAPRARAPGWRRPARRAARRRRRGRSPSPGRPRPRSDARRSMQSAPSRTERPDTECPPARIVNGTPARADGRGDVLGVDARTRRRRGDGRSRRSTRRGRRRSRGRPARRAGRRTRPPRRAAAKTETEVVVMAPTLPRARARGRRGVHPSATPMCEAQLAAPQRHPGEQRRLARLGLAVGRDHAGLPCWRRNASSAAARWRSLIARLAFVAAALRGELARLAPAAERRQRAHLRLGQQRR